MTGARRLRGRRVVTTRDRRGPLDSLLAAEGADVVHVPLIEIVDAPGVDAALARLADADWLVVTSRHGAERTGRAAARHPDLRLAAVGTASAERLAGLAGRPVDVVPGRQTASDLVAAVATLDDRRGRVLVAQADRADATLADGLRAAGFDVDVVTAYSTQLRRVGDRERSTALGADAVAFASGSAIEAWVQAIGHEAPPVVAAIGPSTAAVGERVGLMPTHVAADHDVGGLAATVIAALQR